MKNLDRGRALASELGLERAPVALAFVEAPPDGVSTPSLDVPSACTFWRLAEDGVFYAPADRHYECPVGTMTMGFTVPADREPAAQQLVGTMVELGYFGMDEVPHLPAVGKPHAGVVYGRLDQFPIEPDVVLVLASPRQLMLLAEADEGVVLRRDPGVPTMGRPACAAVARAANESRTTYSLGCIGARTYLDLADDQAVAVVPGAALDRVVERLPTIGHANRQLAQFHQGRKAEFPASAGSPRLSS